MSAASSYTSSHSLELSHIYNLGTFSNTTNRVQHHKNGKHILFTVRGTLCVYDIQKQSVVSELKTHNAYIGGVLMTDDDESIIVIGDERDSNICINSMHHNSGELKQIQKFAGWCNGYRSYICISNNILILGEDKDIVMYEVNTGKQ